MTEDEVPRLAELTRRTAGIGPRPGFQARVLAAVAARARTTLRSEVVRAARLFVPVALLLAVVSLGFAVRVERVSSAAFAAAEWRSEVDW